MAVKKESGDTSHLYDGKTVRSSAPSRKAIAGSAGIGTEIPKDAIPEIEVPKFIESLLGGPIVPKMKFLKPDKMVQNLQLAVYCVLAALGFLTFVVSPGAGTIWFMITGSVALASIIQIVVILFAAGLGFYGVYKRDGRFLLGSQLLFILAILRFASSKVSLAYSPDVLANNDFLLGTLVVVYAVLLIMYIELSSGVLRYSMLDTSIRTNEVYVMNPGKIVGKYHRALVINPVIAVVLATLVLSANRIVPIIVNIFNGDLANQLRESVELTSVYGVALGTLFVFLVVGGLFALNLPTHIQNWRESSGE